MVTLDTLVAKTALIREDSKWRGVKELQASEKIDVITQSLNTNYPTEPDGYDRIVR